ncbi:hypothetical protein KR51_00033650 [Rubidibacter lacunae KORDI 51-2]|uniref:Uncharacterized protein n=1 Tax=Rubidibacter lacunae KORDI 51-2 TaxID=582515 RepID=U5DK70_9CHRO|nr:hypothetical protein KR51_00033650 [Rubidibacter lacunae KORDI 51-2]
MENPDLYLELGLLDYTKILIIPSPLCFTIGLQNSSVSFKLENHSGAFWHFIHQYNSEIRAQFHLCS